MRTRLAGAALAIAVLASPAWAQGPGRNAGRQGPRDGGPRMEERLRAAGLTDAQIDQLKQMKSEQRKAEIRRRADLRVARLELHELLSADRVDEGAVGAKVKQLSDLQAAELRARVDGQLAARKVMTAEQYQKVKSMRGERRGAPGRHGQATVPPAGGGPGGPFAEEPDDLDDPGRDE